MRPADQPADGIDQAIEAGREDQAGNAQKRRGRHIVAGDGKSVLKAGDPAAGSVEVRRRRVRFAAHFVMPRVVATKMKEHDDGREH